MTEPTEKRKHWEVTGVITTSFMMDACIEGAMARNSNKPPDPAKLAIDRIQERVRLFELNVWSGGLRAHLESHPQRGEKLEHDGLSMLTFVMAGRVMITLEDDRSSLTVITIEEKDDRPRMGIQGICAREHQALDLLERAERAWLQGLRTTPDKEVRMAGM